jgi:beta-galactosidase
MHFTEYEDPRPGWGAETPRAWTASSDAVRMSLNGKWGFRYSPDAPVDDDFHKSGYDETGWSSIDVPAHRTRIRPEITE